MTSAGPNESECYRMIVFGRKGAEVLVTSNCGKYALPCVTIPRWQRVAEHLTAAVKIDWGVEVVCLFEPENESLADCPTKYHFAEHVRDLSRPKSPTQWISVFAIDQESLIHPDDYSAIMGGLCVSKVENNTTAAGPFARLGWLRELRGWIESVIEPMGFHLSAEFRQLNASPSFSLIRFVTDGPALWFKAVGEPNQKEFAITRALAQLFPNYLPRILGIRPDWNGWLSSEAEGNMLSEVQEKALWERAAAALARLQIQSIDQGSKILSAGARKVGSASLSNLIQPFMSVVAQLMERQTKIPPPVLDSRDLSELTDSLHRSLEAMEATGIPDTLGHLDVNPGNIFVSENGFAFLDWADAYIGNPFFSLEYLLQHASRAFGEDSDVRTRMITAFRAQWDGVISPAAIEDALAFAPLLAAYAYAAGDETWKQTESFDDAVAGYLRSLARRMRREARESADWRPLCLK